MAIKIVWKGGYLSLKSLEMALVEFEQPDVIKYVKILMNELFTVILNAYWLQIEGKKWKICLFLFVKKQFLFFFNFILFKKDYININ